MVLGPVLEFWKRKCWSGGFKVPELLPACLRSSGCLHNHSVWPWSHTKRQIASYPIWSLKQGVGAAFVKPGKGHPEVSSGPLRTVKISWFIQWNHLPTLMYSHCTSGGQITSYSHCIKRIWSFPTFLGGWAAFVKPGKGRPKVSSGPLRTVKISWFIQCIHLPTLMYSHWSSGGRITSYSHRIKRIWLSKRLISPATRGPQKKLPRVKDQKRRSNTSPLCFGWRWSS